MEDTRAEHATLLSRVLEGLDESDLEYVSHLIEGANPSELALLAESMPPAKRDLLWAMVPDAQRGEVLAELHEEVRNGLLAEMDTAMLLASIQHMEPQDLADVIEDLPKVLGDTILESLSDAVRQGVETTLTFDEDTAGRLMSSDVITVRPETPLAVVQRYLRRIKTLPDHTDRLMVLDHHHGRYLGSLLINDIITNEPDLTVSEIMRPRANFVGPDMSAHEVAALFERRDLVSVAVVGENDELLGRITIDYVLDVIRDEADHAIMQMAGLNEEDDLFAPVIISTRRRAVWLGINLITAFLAAWVIGLYESTLQQIVALAVLMPIVASMGGIAGSQTLTLAIRGLALGQISAGNLKWLARKEVVIGLINGVMWAIVVAAVAGIWFESVGIGAVIGAAIVINLLAAAASGMAIPVILDKMGIDPALSGAVILTTVTDVVGFMSFLGLATIFLL